MQGRNESRGASIPLSTSIASSGTAECHSYRRTNGPCKRTSRGDRKSNAEFLTPLETQQKDNRQRPKNQSSPIKPHRAWEGAARDIRQYPGLAGLASGKVRGRHLWGAMGAREEISKNVHDNATPSRLTHGLCLASLQHAIGAFRRAPKVTRLEGI